MTSSEIAEGLVSALHRRVDGTFLPLSIRQNRVEDIFLLFLGLLVPESQGERPTARTSEEAANFFVEQMQKRRQSFRLPTDTTKLEVLKQWIRSELVVDSRTSNRRQNDKVSIVPLHATVAEHFFPSGNPPAYGRFIAEMLARENGNIDQRLLRELSEFFDAQGDEPVPRIIAAALDGGADQRLSRRFESMLDPNDRLVWSASHGRLFREQVTSALALANSGMVSRQTFVNWFYALIAFFVATYFLRMAYAAESFAAWLERCFDGERQPWSKSIDSAAFAPRLPYCRREETHARLLKRFPANTSEIAIATQFAQLCDKWNPTAPNARDPLLISNAVIAATSAVDAKEIFGQLANKYPAKGTEKAFKLEEVDKQRLILLAGGAHPFTLAARILNFEDMARSSNNVMEWQFYSNLARHPQFGFARVVRGSDALLYRASDALIVALAHCHGQQQGALNSAGVATLRSFVEYLTSLGFDFDGYGREQLELQLIELGLLESLADASDAKYLTFPTVRDDNASETADAGRRA